MAGQISSLPSPLVGALETLRGLTWIIFLMSATHQSARTWGARSRRALGLLALGVLVLVEVLRLPGLLYLSPAHDQLWRLGLAVAGMALVENLWRNTPAERRWHIKFLCLAIGGLFAYDLFLSLDIFWVSVNGLPIAGAPPIILT